MKTNTKTLNFSVFFSKGIFRMLSVFVLLTFLGCNKDDGNGVILSDEGDLCLVEMNGVFEELELDQIPLFIDGGADGFINAIGAELSYPPEARENGIEGLCKLNYEITEEGKVENIETTQDPGGGIGEASITSLSVVTEGISFTPGMLNGNAVRVKKELELNYKIQ